MKKILPVLFTLVLMCSLSTCTREEAKATDIDKCLRAMENAVIRGDTEAGLTAELERNALLSSSGSAEAQISYDELDTLSRFIAVRCSPGLPSFQLRLCVGEVAMNRLLSPSCPDTLKGVCEGLGVSSEALKAAQPTMASVSAAVSLLQGERLLAPEVLYISEKGEGEIYATFYSRLLGYTYFCTGE